MFDSFNRDINYLRVSVTDRCNLRCTYCMPEEGVKLLSHSEILSLEEITDFIKLAASNGITKVRITGGEPLVRKGVPDFISMIESIPGINDLSLTTNGILLKKYAPFLKDAGLKRINISLDTVDHDHYRQITRGGNLQDVLDGIDAALLAGFNPVKLNCVIKNSASENDARSVRDFAEKLGIEVRFIHMMNLEHGNFSVVEGGNGGHCESCNRLRLTANGKLKPCLFNDLEFDIRKLGFQQALNLAVAKKPVKGSFNLKGQFYNIGG